MTFAEDVATDIASIGNSTTIAVKVVTETNDGYGNESSSYASAVNYSGLVSRVSHEEVLREFGEITGEVIKIHLPSTATVKERDRVTYDSSDWIVLNVVDSDYEGAITKKTVFARREVSSA